MSNGANHLRARIDEMRPNEDEDVMANDQWNDTEMED